MPGDGTGVNAKTHALQGLIVTHDCLSRRFQTGHLKGSAKLMLMDTLSAYRHSQLHCKHHQHFWGLVVADSMPAIASDQLLFMLQEGRLSRIREARGSS